MMHEGCVMAMSTDAVHGCGVSCSQEIQATIPTSAISTQCALLLLLKSASSQTEEDFSGTAADTVPHTCTCWPTSGDSSGHQKAAQGYAHSPSWGVPKAVSRRIPPTALLICSLKCTEFGLAFQARAWQDSKGAFLLIAKKCCLEGILTSVYPVNNETRRPLVLKCAPARCPTSAM
ncbi:uncharacterized protein LOC144158304 isoform X3 [Haemaphysalis longicornis]